MNRLFSLTPSSLSDLPFPEMLNVPSKMYGIHFLRVKPDIYWTTHFPGQLWLLKLYLIVSSHLVSASEPFPKLHPKCGKAVGQPAPATAGGQGQENTMASYQGSIGLRVCALTQKVKTDGKSTKLMSFLFVFISSSERLILAKIFPSYLRVV